MTKDVLIVAKKKGKEKMKAKVVTIEKNRYTPYKYSKIIDYKNYKDLALFLSDLRILFDAPVDKAVKYISKAESDLFFA